MSKAVNISVRLDTDTYNVVTRIVKETETSYSHVIRKHLRDSLKKAGYLSDSLQTSTKITSDSEDWEIN